MHTRKTGLLDKENKRQSQSDYLQKYSIENEKNNSNQLLYEKYSIWYMLLVKFIYSEKATKFCKIPTLLLSYVVPVKSKIEIVAFSEYMNFINNWGNWKI